MHQPEPRFEVGEPVYLITKNGTKNKTIIKSIAMIGNEIKYFVRDRKRPVSEDRLEPISDRFEIVFEADEDFGPIEFTPDGSEIEIDLDLGNVLLFETGDVVQVEGYPGRYFVTSEFTIILSGRTDQGIPEIEVEWLLIDAEYPADTSRSICAYEEDMKHAGEISETSFKRIYDAGAMFGAPWPEPQRPKPLKEERKHRSEEKRKLAKLAEYREMAKRADRMITDHMTMYGTFGDERYLRRAERLKAFKERIPTRGYQID